MMLNNMYLYKNKKPSNLFNFRQSSTYKRSYCTISTLSSTISLSSSPCTKITSKYFPKRFMKRIACHSGEQLLKRNINQERLIYNTQEYLETIFGRPLITPTELLERKVKFILNPELGENITKQTLSKVAFSRVSFKKQDIYAAFKVIDNTSISSKIKILDPKEKTDVRFMLELKTASKYSETSDNILQVTMNSEKPGEVIKVNIGSNKLPDVAINISNNNIIYRDIKSGDNISYIDKGVIAEIPYVTQGNIYTILNKGFSLEQVNERRQEYLKHHRDIYDKITNIMLMSDIDIYKKNILIQEELFLFIKNNPKMTLSFYYHVMVPSHNKLNKEYFNHMKNYIEDTIFDNKNKSKTFIIEAIKAYNEKIKDISSNIKRSKDAWYNTGFGEIADDLFTS